MSPNPDSSKPVRQNHPLITYPLALIFFIFTGIVIAGAVHHLAFSHHGPQLLEDLAKHFEEEESEILTEARKLSEAEKHRHFHNIVDTPKLPEKDLPVCFICHSDTPHSKSKKVRSLNNMHTQFFVCESCHIETKENEEVVYQWYNPLNPTPKGPFFGTDYAGDTGELIEIEDKLSKMAPYFRTPGGLESAIWTQDAPVARDYVKIRDKLSPEQRDGVKKKFHIRIKPKGFDCQKCHADKSIINFKELGFSDKRTVDLIRLNISGMITKYETFYLPNLYKEDEEKKMEIVENPDAKSPELNKTEQSTTSEKAPSEHESNSEIKHNGSTSKNH